MELAIAFVILLATIVIGVPVVYAFGATTVWLVFSLGFDASFVYTTMYSKMNGVVLLVHHPGRYHGKGRRRQCAG